MGIIGTVMGLVHVLQNLAAPSTLGPSISSAFVATLFGIGTANVIYLPVANRLEGLSAAEVELRMLTLDGILAVQAGDNPRVVAEKLNSYIAPSERQSERGQRGRDRRARAGSGSLMSRAGSGRRNRRGGGGGEERERRTLAAHLLGHDHAAAGAVHRPVLDLLGQHLEVRHPAAVAQGGVLRSRSGSSTEAGRSLTRAPIRAPSTIRTTP